MAKAIAGELGFIHIDSGAMYRALTWLALQEGVGAGDEEGLSRLAKSAEIRFRHVEPRDGRQLVYCRGQNVTDDIRNLQVSQTVSAVAALPGVREAMVEAQKQLAAGRDVVMDGRDIGTVVLPEAECKIFLTASVEERAKRRWREREGQGQALEEIVEELRKRDDEDTNRKASPLRQAEGSVLLDTTPMSFQEAVEETLRLVRESGANREKR